ncbi:MAG: hypothetical protein HYY17_05270 [Planctomycetes bacterium]|nr:hypothetical protein [Planctomycetota bacterium]
MNPLGRAHVLFLACLAACRSTTRSEPYPLELPSSTWSFPAARTWMRLQEPARASWDNVSPERALRELCARIGVALFMSEVTADENLRETCSPSLRCSTWWDALCSLLPEDLDFEIASDGSVRVAPAARLGDRGLRAVSRRVTNLRTVEAALAEGWNGIDFDTEPLDAAIHRALARDTPCFAFQDVDWILAVDELREATGLNFVANSCLFHLEAPTVKVEGSLRQVLDELCGLIRAGWYVEGGVIVIERGETARRRLRAQAVRRFRHETALEKLRLPLDASGALSVPQFARAILRSAGLRVAARRDVWKQARFDAPKGTTILEALRMLSAQAKCRWAVFDGEIYLVP